MQVITKIFTALSDLGGGLAMPIVFTVFGLLVGMKFKDALRSGLLYGVGFSGLWLVLGYFLEGVADATVAISNNLGLSLDVTDAGWMVGADIAFSSSLLPVAVVCIILVNALLIAVGFLKTLNIDIWNYWIMITGGAIVYNVTGSYLFGLVVIILSSVIIAKLADIYAKNSWDAIDVPEGISLPHMDTISMALYVIWAVVASKGNMFRSLVTATIGSIVYMYCGSYVAEAYTATAVALGAVSSGTLISSISAGNPLYSIFLFIAKLFVR